MPVEVVEEEKDYAEESEKELDVEEVSVLGSTPNGAM